MYRISSPEHTAAWHWSETGHSLNTSLAFSHTRKCHYQWFRRCKKGTCCSFFCNFATRVRMDWEELFVIVRLSALLPVWRSDDSFYPFGFYFHLNLSYLFLILCLSSTSFFTFSQVELDGVPCFFVTWIQNGSNGNNVPLLAFFSFLPLHSNPFLIPFF